MRILLASLLLCLAASASAGELSVQVRTPQGAPVRDAVVSLYPAGRAAPLAASAGPYQIAQRDVQFTPFVLVVPVGATIAFPNYDSFRHHVYSFSPAKRFELKLYAKEQNRTIRFDKAGAVALGCNIHDAMTAFVKVSDTGLAVRTDGAGRARFGSVPAGPLVARIWHPYLRAPGNQIETRWTVGRAAESKDVAVVLRVPPRVDAAY